MGRGGVIPGGVVDRGGVIPGGAVGHGGVIPGGTIDGDSEKWVVWFCYSEMNITIEAHEMTAFASLLLRPVRALVLVLFDMQCKQEMCSLIMMTQTLS